LKSRVDNHVDRLMDQGRSFLAEGRGGEASLRFSRILLDDPGHAAARQGQEEARALLGEGERLAGLKLHEAQAAVRDGRVEEARRLSNEALECGADPAVVQSLLDRFDPRSGKVSSAETVAEEEPPGAGSALPSPRGYKRGVLVFGWGIALVLLLGTVAVSWERILGKLSGAPRPDSAGAPPITSVPQRGLGEAAVAEARQLLEAGHAASALRTLDRIPADDPAQPYARQVRAQVEAALGVIR
jgi:hypothetical protein